MIAKIIIFSNIITMPTGYAYRINPYSRRNHNAASKIQAVVRRKKVKNVTKNLKLSKPVAALVEKRIKSNQETNTTYLHFRRTQFANIPTGIQRAVQILPPINQGDSRIERLGSKLTLQSGYTKGLITIPADDNPILGNGDRPDIMFRMMLVSPKQFDAPQGWVNQYVSNIFPNIFKPGDTGVAPAGTMIDMWQPINRDVLTVHFDKTFHLKRNYPFFPDPTSTSGATTQKPVSIPFTIKHKVKNKVLHYSGSGASVSCNYDPRLICTWAYTNGAAASASAVPFVEHWSQWYFKY